jgi:hypothetical protein
MAKIKVRKVLTDSDETLVTDDNQEELIEDEDEVLEDGKVVEDEDLEGSVDLESTHTEDKEDEDETDKYKEVELIPMVYHHIEEGTLSVGSNQYQIKDHLVEVRIEDYQACIHHGLVPKE